MGTRNGAAPAAGAASSIDALVGARIAEARRGAGMTVRELAVALQWPHTTLSNYETGRRPIPLDRLAAIANTLRRPPAAFLVETAEEAELITAIAGDVEKCLQIKLVLAALADETAYGEAE